MKAASTLLVVPASFARIGSAPTVLIEANLSYSATDVTRGNAGEECDT
jgi:hypothetical protein